MTLESSVLAELRAKLMEEKGRLENELGRIAKPAEEKGNYVTNFDVIGTDEDENATEVESYVDNLALEDNLEKQLRAATEALEKIESGTYGHCAKCNKEIPLDRLHAYPSAKECIKCSN